MLWILPQGSLGKVMWASTSSSASSISVAILGKRRRNGSATARHWPRAAASVSWAKMVPIRAETRRRWPAGAGTSTFLMKCTRPRGQVACMTLRTAFFRPS